ncbi:MAG: acyl-CoA dehydrogenase family protein, partial [Pseudonocardiales bacterium]|nr:acyl-CoA dehydrogenase family protein [Pseudonocardiales bacterium]
MSDGLMTDDLRELAEAVLASAEPWKELDQAGLTRLTLPEEAGGSGGTLVDLAVVLQAAGAAAADVPLAETDLAAWLLHAHGLAVPDGPLTVAAGEGDPGPAGDRVTGRFARVPWARGAAGIAVLAGDTVGLVLPGDRDLTEGANLAEEPRDTVVVDAVLPADRRAAARPGAARELRLRAALLRSQLLAGAARGA